MLQHSVAFLWLLQKKSKVDHVAVKIGARIPSCPELARCRNICGAHTQYREDISAETLGNHI